MELRTRINEEMKAAMRAQDKARLGTIRLLLSAIKQIEVDTRVTLGDAEIIVVIEKMIKQRRESVKQYEAGNRPELAAIETAEITVLQDYLPQALSDGELQELINAAVLDTAAAGVKDMGKVMNWLKPKIQGRAEMGTVSALIKARLNS